MTTCGKVAWEAYSQAVGGKAFNGDPLPSWEQMRNDPSKGKLVTAWESAGAAVASLVLDNHPRRSDEETLQEVKKAWDDYRCIMREHPQLSREWRSNLAERLEQILEVES